MVPCGSSFPYKAQGLVKFAEEFRWYRMLEDWNREVLPQPDK